LAGSGALPDDPLDLLFHRLVENLAALDPDALHRPFPVADIADRLVPYRTHRKVLGVDTGEDYEMTVLRLLAGEGGYLDVYPAEVREAFVAEAAAGNPDTGIFRRFPEATALLAPERVAEVRGGDAPIPVAAEAEPVFTPEHEPVDGPAPADDTPGDDVPADEPLPFMLADEGEEGAPPAARAREIDRSAPCSYCGGPLPVGRTVLFCPHCGQNVGVVHCPTCGSELDVGWTFCITCGQKVTGIG